MTASTDADELSPLALAAEDARPSLDDVLGPERKPSREGGVLTAANVETMDAAEKDEEDEAANDEDDVAPCCQRTGPCRWDVVCRAHVRRWEAAHGEKYVAFLRRTGGVVPAWLGSADDGGDVLPGQRGSSAAVATNAAGIEDYANDEDDELDVGLLGNGGDDALVEVAGRGEADGEPSPFGAESVMELDDDMRENDDDASGFENPVLAAAIARGSEARVAEAGELRLDETEDLEA